MWYSKITFLTINETANIDIEVLANALSQNPLKECGVGDGFSFGWIPLIENSELWSLKSNNCLFMQAAKEIRVVDTTVLKQELSNKVSKIELERGTKVGRKEKADLKDELLYTMRAKAPTKRIPVQCYIDFDGGFLAINSTQGQMLENIFKLLQTTLGSFPVIPFSSESSPSSVMTEWIMKNNLPASLETNQYVSIKDHSEDQATIEFKNVEPLSADVTRHLENGMSVSQLALKTESLNFVLKDNLSLSKIKFSEILKHKAFEDSDGGKASDLDAISALQSLEFRQLHQSLGAWFN
jgi:recombination associated protein RdgC